MAPARSAAMLLREPAPWPDIAWDSSMTITAKTIDARPRGTNQPRKPSRRMRIHPKRVRPWPRRGVIVACVEGSPAQPAGAEGRPDPGELLKSRSYVALLVLGGIVGAPIAAIAYFFLKAVAELQHYFYETLPGDLGFSHEPLWWPLPLLVVGGLLVGLTVRDLPGTGGHKPAEGLKTGTTSPIDVPGIILAALATLSCGAVLGPEAPLIAIGAGRGVLVVHLVKRDAPPTAALVIGVAGSFAAVSTLLGSPLVGAFLLMEASGIGGPLLGVVLVPGLLAAGVGALIFVGLDNWTGFGTFSLG